MHILPNISIASLHVIAALVLLDGCSASGAALSISGVPHCYSIGYMSVVYSSMD